MSVLASAKRKASARLSAHSRYRASNRKLVLNRRRVSNRKRMLIRKRVILVPILLEAITFELGLTDGLESTLFRHHLNPHRTALALEWWFGGCTKSCLCVSFSGVLVMISGLGYVGVHEDNHHRGRPCAGAIGFSIENGTTSAGSDRKYMSCLHEKHGWRATPCTNHRIFHRNGCQNRDL